MVQSSNKKNITIQHVLAALLDDQTIFPAAYLRSFSDLEGADLESLRSVWPQVSARRRISLLEDLEELNDNDTIVLFDEVAKLALTDSEPNVRASGLRLLMENDDAAIAKVMMEMASEDPAMEVRAEAAFALGKFIFLGEIEEISQDVLHRVEERLLSVLKSTDEPLVRRRALEALGFSGRDDVVPQIRAAHQNEDADWQASALFAMGRSANSAWAEQVLRSLRSKKLNVLLEAVRAAGELELEDARTPLLKIATAEQQDSDVRAAAFWALSKIGGGDEVREAIEQRLEETDDEEEAEYLEEVLDNLTFTEGFGPFSMFDMDALGEEAEFLEEDLEAGDIEEAPDETEDAPKPQGRRRHKPRTP